MSGLDVFTILLPISGPNARLQGALRTKYTNRGTWYRGNQAKIQLVPAMMVVLYGSRDKRLNFDDLGNRQDAVVTNVARPYR